ncbi:hypothetical protein T01_4576 [Trichinella spiralis]|uniref:Uncharacterized protein n=1 Tax=Trichinella spiralis TaxID=6334 RepID=A0A0V0Z5R5_TRISP|nr:hypothetical protein T01_4576 [Trichinella spiralis]
MHLNSTWDFPEGQNWVKNGTWPSLDPRREEKL